MQIETSLGHCPWTRYKTGAYYGAVVGFEYTCVHKYVYTRVCIYLYTYIRTIYYCNVFVQTITRPREKFHIYSQSLFRSTHVLWLYGRQRFNDPLKRKIINLTIGFLMFHSCVDHNARVCPVIKTKISTGGAITVFHFPIRVYNIRDGVAELATDS